MSNTNAGPAANNPGSMAAPAAVSQQAGGLSAILARAADALTTNPAAVEKHARELLKSNPGQQQILLLLVSARRAQGDTAGTRAMLESLARTQPKLAAIHFELGLLLGELGEHEQAIAALSRVVELEPHHPSAWRALGDQWAAVGNTTAAADAYAKQFASSVNDLKTLEDMVAPETGQTDIAEGMLRQFLGIYPTDPFATYMLAMLGMRLHRLGDAEKLFVRALELAPRLAVARKDYAVLLLDQNPGEGDRQIDILLEHHPRDLTYRTLKVAALLRIGDYEKAIGRCEEILRDFPDEPRILMAYGNALKTGGRTGDAIAAYRRGLAVDPGQGEIWWSLANLKTFRFETADIENIRARLKRDDLPNKDRYLMLFSLGKALEDREAYAESFAHYRDGNALWMANLHYDAEETSQFVHRSKALFTREYFRARNGLGCKSSDPIFILGMPRSGSTLVEQILASHTAVEGTMELPDISSISMRLNDMSVRKGGAPYPEILARLGGAELKSLGGEYLERTRVQRKLGRPFFTDKMPNNFFHVGLILSILPNAKIIDTRRHPLACCMSNFKQHFASGFAAAYDLAEIGRFYSDYVKLMAHFDAVLPGRIHRVFYEDMVGDPAKEVHRLLDYCGLPFEDACLRFHETERGVRTASSEQVRRPIYRDSVEHWRNYEPWLEPLIKALGPVLDMYPAVPD